MSELERLLVSSEDELERALLGSVLAESPSSGGMRATALALGLTASTATALVTTLPSTIGALGVDATASVSAPLGAAAVTPTVAASTVVATAGAASLATLGKSLLGGALVSFLALTTVEHASRPSESERPRANVTTAFQSAPQPPVEVATALPPLVAPPAPTTTVTEPSARRSVARAANPMPAPAPPQPAPPVATAEAEAPRAPATTTSVDASLAAETRLLDRARSALASGDTGSASQLLEQYYAAKPSAVLAHEAALLRVRLLLATGRRAAAAAEARRIISLYPKNSHADSLRRLAAEP